MNSQMFSRITKTLVTNITLSNRRWQRGCFTTRAGKLDVCWGHKTSRTVHKLFILRSRLEQLRSKRPIRADCMLYCSKWQVDLFSILFPAVLSNFFENFSNAVPKTAPKMKVQVISSTKLNASWTPLTKREAQGIVVEYKLQWRLQQSPSSRVLYLPVNVEHYIFTGK